nr:MAG TPA: PAX Paired Box domain [Caudoviricetes sp.]
MAATTTCLELAEGDREELEGIARTGTEMARRVDRARMLLAKAGGESAAPMAARLGVDPNTVKLCVRRYRDGGLGAALADAPGRGRPRGIGGGDRAWVVDVARARPADLGYAAGTRPGEALARHVRGHAGEAGHPALPGASRATVHRMLDAAEPRPDRVTYYCERRDPDFGRKTREVLVVYQQLSFRFDEDGNLLPWEEEGPEVHVVSADEKPGIQALSPTGEDLRPTPGVRGGAVTRDHERRRRGTPALLAGIDLQNGTVEGVVRERHRSRESVELPGPSTPSTPRGTS